MTAHRERAFVDTSAWFAYANRRDPAHAGIRRVLRTFQGRLITSNFFSMKPLPCACIALDIKWQRR
jgi:hypothetical protein